jgi:HEAT repeat protein
MNNLEEILKSKIKPKEKISLLTQMIKDDNSQVSYLIDLFKRGSDVEKGTCSEVMKFVSQNNPEVMLPYIDFLIEYINYDSPRVKWGIPESIGYLAKHYPRETESAIPKLLRNAKDDSTVIRWCAAFGLSEIAKYNLKNQKELVLIINELIEKEKNNGVKNVYIKALKIIEK